jgi:radical SAM protein with 4Fe4S-binding SPASM domain
MPRGFESAIGGASNELQIINAYLRSLMHSGWTTTADTVLRQMKEMGYAIDEALAAAIAEALKNPENAETKIAPHVPLGCLNNGVVLSSLHFASRLSEYQKRSAFKSSVRKIDIETSTQCNRRCSYCSNSIHDRRSANTYMADAVFERLINELAEIDYCGQVSFVGHNEPLMHFDNLEKRIAYARPRLPNARITVFSNSDYLNADMLKMLEERDIDDLNLTIHPGNGKPYDEIAAMQRMFDLAKKLNLKPEIEEFMKSIKVGMLYKGSKFPITIRAADMQKAGHNQGGGVPGAGVKTEGRTDPCAESLFGFIVGYTGNVHPCSLVVADIPAHAHCIMGNIKDTSIFDIYTGEKFIAWRRRLLVKGPKAEPCASCPCYVGSTPANWGESVQNAMAVAAAADAGQI